MVLRVLFFPNSSSRRTRLKLIIQVSFGKSADTSTFCRKFAPRSYPFKWMAASWAMVVYSFGASFFTGTTKLMPLSERQNSFLGSTLMLPSPLGSPLMVLNSTS